jgi:colanic acid biosynthesis glycosyl transferase WcaI
MRIVLLNQFFWPDTSATSQILSDTARFLAKDHDVSVICARTGAMNASFEPGFEADVSIVRTISTSFGHRSIQRLSSYISYLLGCIYFGLTRKRPDVYVTLTTPPILSVVGSLLSSLRGSSHIIWEMDVYPDIATDVQYFKSGGMLDRVSGMILDWSRRRASSIIVLGDEMKDRLKARGIPESKQVVVENWADGKEVVPIPFFDGPLVILYSGNLGLAHETRTIQGVLGRLGNHPDFRFVFVGGGPRRKALEEACSAQKLLNVEFRPYCKQSELGKSLAEGHVGLVTQLPQTLGSVVPSKIYGIMAAGRPLLYIGPDGSTPARHIRRFQCGWHIQPGDTDSLESLLIRLQENRHLLLEAGARARAAFEMNFDCRIGVERIGNVLFEHSHSNQTFQPPIVSTDSFKGDQ